MQRLKWYYHKNTAAALYKQRCHMSHVCSHSNSNNWHNYVRSSLKDAWNSRVFICRLNAMVTIQQFWRTPAEHSRPVQRPLKMLDRQCLFSIKLMAYVAGPLQFCRSRIRWPKLLGWSLTTWTLRSKYAHKMLRYKQITDGTCCSLTVTDDNWKQCI